MSASSGVPGTRCEIRVQGHLLVCNRDGGSGWPNPHHLHVTATVTIAVAIAIAVTLTLPAIAVVVGRGKGGALSQAGYRVKWLPRLPDYLVYPGYPSAVR